MAFAFTKLDIPEVILIKTDLYGDSRGFFMETYKRSEFMKADLNIDFVQDSHSLSEKNVLRGLHYQLHPKAQAKIVRCIKGEIFDVAVDIRPCSKNYGKWVSAILSEENHNELYIPIGFAHGFCVLSDQAEIIYKQSNEYSLEHERGILWNDPTIAIRWPIESPIIAERDGKFPLLKSAENNYNE
jgi:dTDP-4-dehydrorhamnose 3,5-epimerase